MKNISQKIKDKLESISEAIDRNDFDVLFIILLLFYISLEFAKLNAYPLNNQKLTKLTLNNVTIKSYCDQVIKDQYQRKCYLFKARKPRFNFYFLKREITNASIKKRFSFKNDKRLKVPNYIKCYYKSGFDRGHLAPDADFDYNLKLIKTTYLSSNIVPEKPYTNRRLISKIERRFRKLINKYNEAYIITGAHYRYQKEFLFNPKNKYHLNCGYYPDYIFKIILIPKYDIVEAYKITNIKPYKIKKLNSIQTINLLNENKILIENSHFIKQRRFYGK